MNAETTVRELIERNLSDDHDVDAVQFVDRLLLLASEIGVIKCALANERAWRFELPSQPACEVEMSRAKSKLRLVCARLAKMCHDNDHEFILYGGEGSIASNTASLEAMPSAANQDGAAPLRSPTRRAADVSTWKIRLKNTTSEQEFIIQAQ